MSVRASAPAKINLTLAVTGRRADGYHEVDTAMQALSLREEVAVCETGGYGVALTADGPLLSADIPTDARNTAVRAADAFFAAAGIPPRGLHIHITKRIPSGAGLAGGSADAAAVLAALNRLTGAELSPAALAEIGAGIGADVPFCVLGGAALGTGTGTALSPLPPLPDCAVVLAKPAVSVSTADAYRRVDAAGLCAAPGDAVPDALRRGSLAGVAAGLSNAFADALALPETAAITARMREFGALGCQMTGSGSAVFGLFADNAAAEACRAALQSEVPFAATARPDNGGVRLLGL